MLPKTLFGQLLLGITLVQTVFLGGFIWYIVVSQRSQVQDRLRQRMDQQLDVIGDACSKALAKGDMASLHDLLEVSRMAPSVSSVRVTDAQGKTLAVTPVNEDHGLDPYEQGVLNKASRRQIFRIKNGQLEGVTPVLRGGRPAALVWLEPNHAATLNTINTVVRIAVSYGIFALLVNILPIFFIVRTVTRPLRRLKDATYRVGTEDDLKAGFPLPIKGSNEAGVLTASFNSMVGELQEQKRGLMETLALLDSMLDNAPVGFGFFDRDLRYVRVNRTLARMHDMPMEDHPGRRGTELYPWSIAEQKETYLSRVFETGEAIRNVELSGELAHEPGVQRSWLMHFYPVRILDEEIRWVGVVVADITDRIQTEEALRKTEKLAAAGRLAASIAHEINNPLESVTNLLYLLHMHQPMDPPALELIATAQSELARVAEITQQTLRFHRQTSFPSNTNIAEIFESLLVLYKARIAGAGIRVEKKFRGTPEVYGFAGELRQLIANLMNNAVDAMAKGGRLRLRARQGRALSGSGAWCDGVFFSVSDTGPGMSMATISKMFEAFFTTKPETGTGLGLWVCQEIIEKHAGTVRVRSRQGTGSGTTFLVFLPREGLKRGNSTA